MQIFKSQCHCGNVEIAFETDKAPEQLSVRACNCSFCRQHGVRSISDPDGQVSVNIHDNAKLSRYCFGSKTADFLICRECGVYLGATFSSGNAAYMVNNLNTFEISEAFSQVPIVSNYDHETEEERRDRRQVKWTPLRF